MKYLLLIFVTFPALANSTVVTTLPELKWIVDEISFSTVKSVSLLSGNEDPHFVDATPSFILKVSNADLVVANGLQLEIGWLPKVIQMAGNGKIQFLSKGYCDTSTYVKKTQVLDNYDRSMGDVHPQGNPHFTLSLSQMQHVAKKVFECLKELRPENEKLFESNYKELVRKLSEHLKKLKEKLKPLSKSNFMTYHREFIYFFQDFDLNAVGTLEKVPGILPSASHLYNVSQLAKEKNVKLVLASITNPKKYLDKFTEMTKINFIQLPLHMNPSIKNYFEFQDTLVEEMLKNVKAK